jgi:hypothetical protein
MVSHASGQGQLEVGFGPVRGAEGFRAVGQRADRQQRNIAQRRLGERAWRGPWGLEIRPRRPPPRPALWPAFGARLGARERARRPGS